MTSTRLLSEDEFLACFSPPMRDVTGITEAAVDIWPYANRIDLPLARIAAIGDVAYVYRDADDRFDQVLIETSADNLFLIIVVNLTTGGVHGHYPLDLAVEYGLDRRNP